jgi:Flp pilus assembly protein TadG
VHSFRRTLRRFVVSSRGNITQMMALAIVPLITAAGAATDYSRAMAARTELYAALDTAVLAGTEYLLESDGDETEALQIAEKVFNANMSDRFQFDKKNIEFKLNSKSNGIAASGEASIKTSLMAAVGISSFEILSPAVAEAAAAEAIKGSDRAEVSLMLDVTGSMCNDGSGPCTSGTKITALKTAAANLVDKLFQVDSSGTSDQMRVALVPFSTRVRVGPDGGGASIMNDLTNLQPTWSGHYNMCTAGTGSGASETSGNWTCTSTEVQQVSNWKIMPCVTERYYDASGFDLTDRAPGSDAWMNAHDGSRAPLGFDSSNGALTSGTGSSAADPTVMWNYEPNGSCADVANANQIVPLSKDKTLLKGRINGLEAYGSTGGVLGTAFSWYMLSPNWDLWGSNSKPGSYADVAATNSSGAPKLRKIAVLMTDGGYNTSRGWKDQPLGPINTAAKDMCAAMKQKGIEIYTVGFDLDSLTADEASNAESTLQSCASDPAHYFLATNSNQLVSAFDIIATQIASVTTRLTK